MESNAPGLGDFIGMVLPLVLLWLPTAIVFVRISGRKGVSTLGAIVGSFPLWSVLFGVWLASKTDRAVLERLGLR